MQQISGNAPCMGREPKIASLVTGLVVYLVRGRDISHANIEWVPVRGHEREWLQMDCRVV